MSENSIRLCLIGKGNVGTSLLKLLIEKKQMIKEKYQLSFTVLAIFEYDGGLINKEGLNLETILEASNEFRKLDDWVQDAKPNDYFPKLNLNICIETTPTNAETGEPALSHILEAFRNKIHVVASNKGPFYLKYDELQEEAKKNDCKLRYEATVASCVPALSVKQGLLGNDITSIRAILNGTCNYILSRMSSEGVSFSNALKEAQELGYAEADPTLDIEGYDAAGKLVILANELLGWSKTISDVEIKGISKITPQALELAKTDGYVIKHLAIAEGNRLIVESRLVEQHSPLNISGTLNVLELSTKYAGPIILMGRGAGGYEAAAAILNDLISIGRDLQKNQKDI